MVLRNPLIAEGMGYGEIFYRLLEVEQLFQQAGHKTIISCRVQNATLQAERIKDVKVHKQKTML